jgi:AcrR family transcriptional regulator
MPKLTRAQQAQRRAHILDAAEICFARSGFHRTTMQDICREARVSAGAVYLYFSSKEALIDGIVERDREEIAEELRRVSEAQDLMAGLEGLLKSCVLDRPAHKAALYIEMMAEANRNPYVAQAMRGCESTLTVALSAMLAEAQRQGRIAEGVDPEAVARLLLVTGDGLFVLLARQDSMAVQKVVPYLLAMIRRFLSPQDAPQELPPQELSPQALTVLPTLLPAPEAAHLISPAE